MVQPIATSSSDRAEAPQGSKGRDRLPVLCGYQGMTTVHMQTAGRTDETVAPLFVPVKVIPPRATSGPNLERLSGQPVGHWTLREFDFF